jgi:hypothetical protein
MFELAASEDTRVGSATNSVVEEVFGAVLVGKENDAVGTKTSHT